MTYLTRQEIFDKAVSGVLKQGIQSMDPENIGCNYRGEDGAKCAAGHLILDEHYSPVIEGRSVWPITTAGGNTARDNALRDALIASGVDPNDFGLVHELQHAHDYASEHGFIEDFKKRAALVAAEFALSTTVLGEVK